MSGSEDEDLPSISFGSLQVVCDEIPYDVDVDVDAVIRECENRKEKRRQIAELQAHTEELVIFPLNEPPPLQPQLITAFPPQRTIFDPELSQVSFNEGSLCKPGEPFPEAPITEENHIHFFQSLKLKVLSLPPESCREILVFLWLVQSVHTNPQVVWQCNNVLLELNHRWNLKWEEVILVFRNWGTHLEHILKDWERSSIILLSSAGTRSEDILTSWEPEQIKALLHPSPIVTPYNVECTLRILSEQLNNYQLTGDESSQKALFFLLTLLSLDPVFSACLPDIQTCVLTLYKHMSEKKTVFVSEYCETLLKFDLDHAQLAFVAQCVLPEGLRSCLALPVAQHLFKIEPVTYVDSLEPAVLSDILTKHLGDLMKFDLNILYSFLILVDCAVSYFVSVSSDKNIHTELLQWLRDLSYEIVKSCCAEDNIDATVVRELVGRMQTEWEGSWNEGGSGQEKIMTFTSYSDQSDDDSSDYESD